MKILQIVKTSDGADWAFKQVRVLIQNGVEVHIVLPKKEGRFVDEWRKTTPHIHFLDLDIPKTKLFLLPLYAKKLANLVKLINPDLIHSHFFITTIIARMSYLFHSLSPKMIFQVAGPLHLESLPFRLWDLWSSKKGRDYWIASSLFIKNIYEKKSISPNRLFLSYYGSTPMEFETRRTNNLRNEMNVKEDTFLVGNISHMYAPKYYLGQSIGLKCHELMIEAFSKFSKNKKTEAIFIGGEWGDGTKYEERLKELADGKDSNIRMYGHLAQERVKETWAEFDLAIHYPLSENCGGVIEPLMANVPVICSDAGGLPEVIIDNVTGFVVPKKNIQKLVDKMEEIYSKKDSLSNIVSNGKKLVSVMFDVNRTAQEVFEIYSHLLENKKRPKDFDANNFFKENS